MIPTQYASGGSQIEIPGPFYSSGAVPGNTLASQYWNWIFFHLTTELNNVLAAAGIAQNSSVDTQLRDSMLFLSGKEKFTPIAGYTPAAGDVVEMYYDGKIRKSKRVSQSVFSTGNIINRSRSTYLDATHSVVLYDLAGALKAIIVTVDPVTLVPTYGTELAVVATGNGYDVTPIDGTHVLVAYTPNPVTAQQLTLVVLTANIGAGTLSLGTPVNGFATAINLGMCAIPGTSSSFLVWGGPATSLSGAVVTVSGTTPTIQASATQTISSSGFNGSSLSIPVAVNGTGTVAIAGYTPTVAPSNAHFVQFTIAGSATTAVIDTDTLLSASNCGQVEEGPLNTWLMWIDQVTNGAPPHLNFGVIQPTVSSNAGYSIKSIFGAFRAVSGVVARSVDRLGTFVVTNLFGGVASKSMFMTRKGGSSGDQNDFSFGDEYITGSFGSGAGSMTVSASVLPNSGIAVLIIPNATASQAQIIIMRRRNTVLGIAVDNQGTVKRSGTYVGSGLTPGAKYYADDNGILTTVAGEVELGVAFSATQLTMAVKAGV